MYQSEPSDNLEYSAIMYVANLVGTNEIIILGEKYLEDAVEEDLAHTQARQDNRPSWYYRKANYFGDQLSDTSDPHYKDWSRKGYDGGNGLPILHTKANTNRGHSTEDMICLAPLPVQ
jgi:hypothetical protein